MTSWFNTEFNRLLRERVPARLDDLRGPALGVVELPFNRGRYDLAKWKMRIGLYHELIVDCRRGDPERYINRDHFIELWPYIRRRVCDGYRAPWEERFPVLREGGAIDVSIYDPFAGEPFRRKSDRMT